MVVYPSFGHVEAGVRASHCGQMRKRLSAQVEFRAARLSVSVAKACFTVQPATTAPGTP